MKPSRTNSGLLQRTILATLLGAAVFSATARAAESRGWQVLDRVVLPTDTKIEGYRVGGLSGAAFDPRSGLLWTVSDGRQWDASKVFRFSLAVDAAGKMEIRPHSVLSLHRGDRRNEALDAEGIALWTRNRFFVSHEGSRHGHFQPGISAFSQKTGRVLFALPFPEYFFPTEENPAQGLQNNRGFESVTLSAPRATYLYTANESPLMQDLRNAADGQSGFVRILRFQLSEREAPPAQRAYQADRDAVFGSVVELLTVPGTTRLLVLERQLTRPVQPRQRRIRIYEVDFAQPDATDISQRPALREQRITPLRKTLVFDSSRDGLRHLDNLEGLTWGPEVRGRPTLLLVSDDNFSNTQQTEFVLLGPR
jgi:hypothetical protein